ncbi:helix-turn-helix transcriptional regulator [Chryseobacterium shandongense]|uniref:helix-turn-helix transcriptional regulator n=1 Tax=Chryseobacterium shandongense TaxID=1493872 RepID=UPI000F4E2BD3|nr:helix-turn-helix transcriptional regulator [Chryseobacterium shandongense]AZA56142.1 XRE family transcriptional regulator [Chryseobacterium shandongense]
MSKIFCSKLKMLREEQLIPQRQVASVLQIDTATYCKIEKGDRRAKREQVLQLADLFQIKNKELLLLWSADKVYDIIAEEDEATQILNVVAENILTNKCQKARL